MHLWGQHSSAAGQFPAQNPAGQGQHTQQQLWDLPEASPAHQPVLTPAHGPPYQPSSCLSPAQHTIPAGQNCPAATAAAPGPARQQWPGGLGLTNPAASTSPFSSPVGFPADAGHEGFRNRGHTVPQPPQQQQQYQGLAGQGQQCADGQAGTLGLMGPPASRAIPCPMSGTCTAAGAAGAAAAGAGDGSLPLGAGSLSMETSVLDLPEPDAMSWRPGGPLLDLVTRSSGGRGGVKRGSQRGGGVKGRDFTEARPQLRPLECRALAV